MSELNRCEKHENRLICYHSEECPICRADRKIKEFLEKHGELTVEEFTREVQQQ